MLAGAAVGSPAVGGADVAAAGRPGTGEGREPHVELGTGGWVDDDQVVVATGGGLRVARNVTDDRGRAIVEGAANGVELADHVGIGQRFAPGIGGGHVRAPRIGRQCRRHHGRRVGVDGRARRDGRVPEARRRIEHGEGTGLDRHRHAAGHIPDQGGAPVE